VTTASATCDTSVLVPALTSQHPDHAGARELLARVAAVPCHVLLETYSVLTRLPAPLRLSAADAARAIEILDVDVVDLPAARQRDLVAECARHRIGGGAVYDALVGATAAHHDLVLLTRDRRARPTYDAVGVRYALG